MNKEDKKSLSFKDFGLNKDIVDSLLKKGFTKPSEVQEKVIPHILKGDKDLITIAQTGTGKTGAFGIPIVDLIDERNKTPKCIILTPTRELALQVTKEIGSYTTKKRLNIVTIYGGASINNQLRDLKKGVDIVVGTPGRVVDIINRGALDLKSVNYFILDEADEMLNMGFVADMEFILSKTSNQKRVYLFSATMPKQIRDLSKKYMQNQESIEIKRDDKIHAELIEQIFYKVKDSQKAETLMKIIDSNEFFYSVVFCKMKSDVDKLTKILRKNNFRADSIHGDIQQRKREKILQSFRDMKINILVATDVAARGIDVNNITHVVNYSLPQSIDTYIHRIGRTGRAGNKGVALTLLTDSEMRRLSTLEKITGFKLKKETIPQSKNSYETISQGKENRIDRNFKRSFKRSSNRSQDRSQSNRFSSNRSSNNESSGKESSNRPSRRSFNNESSNRSSNRSFRKRDNNKENNRSNRNTRENREDRENKNYRKDNNNNSYNSYNKTQSNNNKNKFSNKFNKNSNNINKKSSYNNN